MIFFAVSGAWQAFRFNDSKKDGSYTAPLALSKLSEIHKAEHLVHGPAELRFKAVQVTIAVLFATTAILGIVMALKMTRPVWLAWLCLATGVIVPVWLSLAAMR